MCYISRLSINDVINWAEINEVPLALDIWLPSGEKFYLDEEHSNEDYFWDDEDDYWVSREQGSASKSWKSSVFGKRNNDYRIDLHVEMNNKYIYPSKPRKKIGNTKGNMLSHVKDLKNLQGEFRMFNLSRKVGLKNYKVLKIEKYWDDDDKGVYEDIKGLQQQLIDGECHNDVGTLLIPYKIKFEEILREVLKKGHEQDWGLPYQANMKQTSFIHPKSNQLYVFIDKEKNIKDFKIRQSIVNKIQKIYNQNIKSKKGEEKLLLNFNIGNQSMASISRNLFQVRSEIQLPNGKWNLFAREQFDKYFTKPINQTFMTTREAKNQYYVNHGNLSMTSHYKGYEAWQKLPWLLWTLDLEKKHIEYDMHDILEKLTECEAKGEDLTKYFESLSNDMWVIDVRKSYSSAMLIQWRDDIQIPVPSICDNIEFYDGKDIKVGFYFVDDYEVKSKKNPNVKFRMTPQFLPHFEVKILMDNYGLKKKHIKYQFLTRQTMIVGIIKDCIKYIYRNFDEDEAKQLVNIFTGTTKFTRVQNNHAFITADKEFVVAYINWKATTNVKTARIEVHDVVYWLVYHEEERRKTYDTTTIYQYIIGAGHLNVLSMLDECMTEKSVLSSIKTDCAYICGEINHSEKIVPLPPNQNEDESSYEEINVKSQGHHDKVISKSHELNGIHCKLKFSMWCS